MDRIKSHFYLYDKLLTYNFYAFEELSLNTVFGNKSHYDKVKLLVDQGFIEIMDKEINLQDSDEFNPLSDFIGKAVVEYKTIEKLFNQKVKMLAAKKCDEDEMRIVSEKMAKTGWVLHALYERAYGLALSNKLNQKVFPTLTLDCYKGLEIDEPKSFIYTVLVDKIPMPDSSIPLVEILQYRNESSNQVRLHRLQSWVNRFSKEGFNETEIKQEIDYLIAEYKNELKLSGLKMNLVRLEFCCKVVPFMVEKVVKLKFSELVDPFFKLKYEKVSLLKEEISAKGSELSFIVNIAN